MLGGGGAQENVLGHDQDFGVPKLQVFQQSLIAVADKDGVQLETALDCFFDQMQAFDGDMRSPGAAHQGRAQFLDAAVLPAFHPSRTTFGDRIHGSGAQRRL